LIAPLEVTVFEGRTGEKGTLHSLRGFAWKKGLVTHENDSGGRIQSAGGLDISYRRLIRCPEEDREVSGLCAWSKDKSKLGGGSGEAEETAGAF